MFECWKQLGQLIKTTCIWCAGAGPCGCFAVRASRSPNLIAHPLATFATRKLLTTFVGGPDRYAAGASRDRRISTPAFFLWRYNWNEYTGEFARAPKKVVSNKLFPKIRRLYGELLEIRENENLMRKILMRVRGRRDEGKG